jgi:hypothetical protein
MWKKTWFPNSSWPGGLTLRERIQNLLIIDDHQFLMTERRCCNLFMVAIVGLTSLQRWRLNTWWKPLNQAGLQACISGIHFASDALANSDTEADFCHQTGSENRVTTAAANPFSRPTDICEAIALYTPWLPSSKGSMSTMMQQSTNYTSSNSPHTLISIKWLITPILKLSCWVNL